MLKVENLSKSFRTEEIETIALDQVSVEVKEGEFVAIMGPSGCGKSSLHDILGGASPKLILADEPTGNLDSRNGAEVMTLLSELNREGTTIIMVTHSQHDASFAHRIVNLLDGRIVQQVADKL